MTDMVCAGGKPKFTECIGGHIIGFDAPGKDIDSASGWTAVTIGAKKPAPTPSQERAGQMTIVSANGDHTMSQSEMETYEHIQRQIGRETLRRHFRNADDKDWDHLFRMLPDSGHGKFWKAVMTAVRDDLRK